MIIHLEIKEELNAFMLNPLMVDAVLTDSLHLGDALRLAEEHSLLSIESHPVHRIVSI